MSAANMGGVADPRLGHESEVIGTDRQNSVARAISDPDQHGKHSLYNDTTISFETYDFWANRSREVEKNISTNAGYAQLLNVVTGKKNPNPLPESHPPTDNGGFSLDEKSEGKTAFAYPGSTDRYGVTENEWQQANSGTCKHQQQHQQQQQQQQ